MFARRCTRLATSRTAIPLNNYLARARQYSSGPSYEHILTSTPKPGVGLSRWLKEIAYMKWKLTQLVTLNRPKALNALCSPLFTELNDALSKYDSDKDIGAIIITGSEKAFAGT
jgi:Enoyl-CoA hydratase/carnithine racemase